MGKSFGKCVLSWTTNLKPTHPKNKTRKREKRVDLRSRYFEELGCGLGLGTWLPPFLSETGSQPDRQASSPPQSDELPVRRCCFLCRIRTKIKSFHGAAISEQQEFDAPDFQVSLFSLRIYLFPPNLCGKCRWICMWFEQGRAGLRKSFVRKIMHVVIGIFSLVVVTHSSTLDSFFILARLLHFRPSALSELLSELSTSGSKRAFGRIDCLIIKKRLSNRSKVQKVRA